MSCRILHVTIECMKDIFGAFRNISNLWFFDDSPWYLKIILIYIKGDTVVLLPFFVSIVVLSFWKLSWAALLFMIFITLRGVGEMVYWIHQQFGDRKYRPYDFGLKSLDNNAIYIIYQLIALMIATLELQGDKCYQTTKTVGTLPDLKLLPN